MIFSLSEKRQLNKRKLFSDCLKKDISHSYLGPGRNVLGQYCKYRSQACPLLPFLTARIKWLCS